MPALDLNKYVKQINTRDNYKRARLSLNYQLIKVPWFREKLKLVQLQLATVQGMRERTFSDSSIGQQQFPNSDPPVRSRQFRQKNGSGYDFKTSRKISTD